MSSARASASGTRSQSKYSRSSSNAKITSNMAAAMLSFNRKPPPEPTDSENDSSDVDERHTKGSKKSSKKNRKGDKRNNNKEDEPKVYEPVTIPPFHEVHTDWPGFDHEPVPNWEEKYMRAKPYPRTVADVSAKSSLVKYGGNVVKSVSSKDIKLAKGSKSRSKNKLGKEEKAEKVQNNEKERPSKNTERPKRIIYVERVGSCIK